MINALDFMKEVADRAGKTRFTTLEDLNPITEHRKLLTLLNTMLKRAGSFNDWDMLRKEGSIVTVASLETDADSSEFVTATQNSDEVTVAGQTFDDTYTGRAFQVNGEEDLYRIIEVLTPTKVKIDRAWVQDSLTVADEKTVTIAMDRYALPADFDRTVTDWQNFFAPYKIEPATPNEFREMRINRRRILLSDPEMFTVFGFTDNESARIVHFYPWPKEARLLRFDYQISHPTIDSDQDNILYPLSYREALISTMLAVSARDFEDSAKMEKILQDSLREHNIQQSNPGLTDSKAQLEPSGRTRRQVYNSYGAGALNVDWGNAFDTGRTNGL